MRAEREAFQVYEDIDLKELFNIIWVGRWKIISITSVFAILSVVYSLSLPNFFKSEVLLAPASSSKGNIGGLSNFGGIASLAGISMGSDDVDDVDLGLATLQSRIFLTDFITRRNILAPLMALESWSEGDAEINADVYDVKNNVWLETKPGLQEAYSAFMTNLSISHDKVTGLVKIAMLNQSPILAQQWVTWLVQDLNDSIRDRETNEAKRAVVFLEEQINSAVLLEMRSIFFKLIQQQTETIMLADVRPDYLFTVVDPAIIPEDKASPNRATICILGTLFGGFLSVIAIFLMHFMSVRKVNLSKK